jgi:hypothetical protein
MADGPSRELRLPEHRAVARRVRESLSLKNDKKALPPARAPCIQSRGTPTTSEPDGRLSITRRAERRHHHGHRFWPVRSACRR